MDSILTAEGWMRVAAACEIPEGTATAVRVSDEPICVVRSRGRWHALRDECTHGQVPLSEGDVEDGTIECWLHGSQFDLSSGVPLTPPATEPVQLFPIRVDGDDVYVAATPIDPEATR